jgi:hypothetical protein
MWTVVNHKSAGWFYVERVLMGPPSALEFTWTPRNLASCTARETVPE